VSFLEPEGDDKDRFIAGRRGRAPDHRESSGFNALSELFASQAIVTMVKIAIPWGFLWLIPALMAAGGSGFALAKRRRAGLAQAKIKRMPWIAANGILVLVPSALFLAAKARAGAFDTSFDAVQALELVAGAANITLLGLNMRDGLKMTGPLPPSARMIGFLRRAAPGAVRY